MEVNDSDYEVTEARYSLSSATFDRAIVRDRVAAISGHFSILFLDLTPALRDGARPFRPVYFSSDSHWNARGQAIAAEAVGAFLVGRKHLNCPVT